MFETTAYLTHDKLRALYDALQESMQIVKLQARYGLPNPYRKKRSHDDQYPLENHEWEKKMKRQKNVGGSLFKIKKALVDTSNYERFKDADEPRQEQERTIPARYFFNNDLEYLRNGNKEKKYDLLVINIKAIGYEQEGIKEMIPYL
uniref:Uncharacterized protein n=1 Tax=Tanacetum cinerariifolium TaxID=118510 RepID=A0A6L2N8R8_TANCI|nr:hypothetical protein [Tanacetum cinerariifolium]